MKIQELESSGGMTQRKVDKLERINQDVAQSKVTTRTCRDPVVDSIFLVDEAGVIQNMNRRAEVKFGCHKQELIGKSLLTFLDEEDRSRFARGLQHVQVTGEEWMGGELKVRHPNGDVWNFEGSLVPIDCSAHPDVIVLQGTDLNEKKMLERQLVRTERLASLTQFTSMFAHDIRNPLAGIKKTLELLGRDGELPQAFIHDRVRDLQFTVDLLLSMINDMLDVYQENYTCLPLTISPFRVEDLLEEVVHLFKNEAMAKEIQIDVSSGQNGCRFPGDRRRLQRVIVNLLHNALKYSPTGGSIKISSFIVNSPFSSERPGPSKSWLMITVADEGPGIAPQVFPHLFEMCFTKRVGPDRMGRGLGLHFCKLVVESHQGRIWAQNLESGGAKFHVALPVEAKEMAHAD